jgi:hypothetical protein
MWEGAACKRVDTAVLRGPERALGLGHREGIGVGVWGGLDSRERAALTHRRAAGAQAAAPPSSPDHARDRERLTGAHGSTPDPSWSVSSWRRRASHRMAGWAVRPWITSEAKMVTVVSAHSATASVASMRLRP